LPASRAFDIMRWAAPGWRIRAYPA